MATGRSDYPNQVNNVLGFPFIFRGALDVAATDINEEMKLAAAKALADLAKEDVPDSVIRAYGGKPIKFGREYLIPKPFDHRVLLWEAPAVAEAAIATGVARKPYASREEYVRELENRLSRTQRGHARGLRPGQARSEDGSSSPKARRAKIVRAAKILADEGICHAGSARLDAKIDQRAARPSTRCRPARSRWSILLNDDRRAKTTPRSSSRCGGATASPSSAPRKLLRDPVYFGNMMVHAATTPTASSPVSTTSYPETIRPALQIHKTLRGRPQGRRRLPPPLRGPDALHRRHHRQPGPVGRGSGGDRRAWPSRVARIYFEVEPRIAMLSYSNFGSNTDQPVARRSARRSPSPRSAGRDLVIEGEMQADTAVEPIHGARRTSRCRRIHGDANILVCPDLESANIAYKLLWRLGKVEAIGPILTGIGAPVHVLQRGVDVDDIVNMAALCVRKAQRWR